DKEAKFNDELKELYTKYKDQAPHPASESRGFKEPRKVKVGWVEATGSEPYYQKASADGLAKTLAAAGLVPPGPSPWTAVVSAAVATADPLVQSVYESEWAGRHRDNLSHRWSSHHLGGLWAALDTSVVRPANVAALVGGLGGGLAAFAPPGAAAAPLLT